MAIAAIDVASVVRSANLHGRLIQSNHEAIANTEELYAAVSDAGTDQRTYLLTKEPAALEGYRSAKARVTSELGELARLLATRRESSNLDVISKASFDRIALLDAEIELHASNKDPSAHFEQDRAKMAELRQAIARLVAREEQFIAERQSTMARLQFVAALESLLAVLGLVLAVWLGANSYFRTRTQLSKRIIEADAADKKFEAIFDQAAVGMAIISPEGRWLRVNNRFCEISGYQREDVLGASIEQIAHPDDVARDFAHLKDLVSGRASQYSVEKQYSRPAGGVVWAKVSAKIIRDAEGQPDFIVKVIEEITDWKNAQTRLITGEAQYRAIFDSAVEAIAVIDEKGVIQSVNPATIKIFGYEPEEMVSHNISMLMPTTIAAQHDSYLARYKKTRKPAIIGIGREVQGLRKDGSLFPLDLSVAEWKQEGKVYYTGIMRDVTARNEAVASLAASEERLRLAQDSTGIGSFDWDLITGEIIGNDGYYAIVGLDRQTRLFANSLPSILHPDERQRMVWELQADSPTEDRTDREVRLKDRDGRPRWVRSLTTTLRDSDNRPYRRTGIIVDITKRKEAEEELRESEERLRIALASGQFGTWTVDPAKASVDLDPIARGIFDLAPGFYPDLFEFAALMHPDDQIRYAKVREGILADAPTLDFEYRIFRRDGSIRWLHATGTRLDDDDPDSTKMIGVIRDVTEQKEDTEKLRQSEERLALALASGNLGTWSFDPKSEIIRFDRLAQSIFGVEADRLDSLAEFKSLLHPDDRPVFDREYQKLLSGADALNVEYRLPREDGSVRWAHVSGTIDREASATSQQLIGVVADITEERNSEERLRVLQNEFAHLARVNDLGEMAAAIAHEINQPLTAITNYLNAGIETARKSADPSAQATAEAMMGRAAEQALRAGQIVRRLREFIGKGTGEREVRIADQLIDAAAEFASVDAGVNGVTVIRKAGAGDALVNVDVVQFQQVVVNLIRNAIESLSTNAPGIERKLTVETKIGKSGKTVEFLVADTGPGISPDIAPKLFEPFNTTKPSGMGMGLSVCKRLIEAHGGSISIVTPPAGGAEFHFTLPIEGIEA